MSGKRLDSDTIVIAVSVILTLAICAALSYYATVQGDATLARSCDEALGAASRRSGWTTLRDGAILGRALPSGKGRAAYLIAVSGEDGEYRAVAEVDGDGDIVTVKPLLVRGTATMRRLGSLIERQAERKPKRDASALDALVLPALSDTLEALARLERARLEEAHD